MTRESKETCSITLCQDTGKQLSARSSASVGNHDFQGAQILRQPDRRIPLASAHDGLFVLKNVNNDESLTLLTGENYEEKHFPSLSVPVHLCLDGQQFRL
jgi:hypothetical protein